MPRRDWLQSIRMSEGEYRANLNGMNIFFGAVLGVVMSRADGLAPWPFAVVLVLTAGMVVSILYVSSSRRRWMYAVLTAVAIYALPVVIKDVSEVTLPPNLRTTLAVWLGMVLFVELTPRVRSEERAGDDEG